MVTRCGVSGARVTEEGVGVRMARTRRDGGDHGEHSASAPGIQSLVQRPPQTGEGDRRLLQCRDLCQATEQLGALTVAATIRGDLRGQDAQRLRPAPGEPELIRHGEQSVPSLLSIAGGVVSREWSGVEG
ncbi:hypothetical protein GCM10011576_62700 [Micromonospora parathelypteridis]|nr:hypothetical protein GCM10011576_62700 [Micromonospora parathelypteridis]